MTVRSARRATDAVGAVVVPLTVGLGERIWPETHGMSRSENLIDLTLSCLPSEIVDLRGPQVPKEAKADAGGDLVSHGTAQVGDDS